METEAQKQVLGLSAVCPDGKLYSQTAKRKTTVPSKGNLAASTWRIRAGVYLVCARPWIQFPGRA